MNDEQRQELIRLLRQGEELSPEWARILFPPEKREYELVYHGKKREEDIIANTLAVPLQEVRTFGRNNDGWRNMLIFGENLQAMKGLLEMKKSGELCSADGTPGVRLVYIDPPFATKRDFNGSDDQRAYQDKVVGAQFLEFIRCRLILIRELLSEDGSIFVHTDWKKGHYLKTLLDEVFGESHFRNEIIWWYYNKLQGNIKRFPSNHESIFYYSVGPRFVFHSQALERESGTHRLLKRVWDGKVGKLVNARDKNGALIYFETDERRLDDVWRLSMLQPADRKENVRYPTQKPETLLAIIVEAASNPGDLIMDCFAGSGTACAVAEKLGRRWLGIDSGKLSVYSIQKRMLTLRKNVGNDGPRHDTKPFTLFNAGLYDFGMLRELSWDAWRFFALQLFQCRDEPHQIGGIQLDGHLKGSSVLVFNHKNKPGARVDEETIQSIHAALGSKVGNRMFVIAPALVFDFQQDYLTLDDVRYYALRIPYSIIHELHQREFAALKQPADELAVNNTVDAVGFDFVRRPELKYEAGTNTRTNELVEEGFIKVKIFKSEAVVREPVRKKANFETLSMVMLDYDFDGESDVFDLDAVFFAEALEKANWELRFPIKAMGSKLMAVFVDIYGNEAREVIPASVFGGGKAMPTIAPAKRSKDLRR